MIEIYTLSSSTKKYSEDILGSIKQKFDNNIPSSFTSIPEHEIGTKGSKHKEMNFYFISPISEEDRARLLDKKYTGEEFIAEYERLKAAESLRINNKIGQDGFADVLNDVASKDTESKRTGYDFSSVSDTIKYISNFFETNYPISDIEAFIDDTDAPYNVSAFRRVPLNDILRVPLDDGDFCRFLEE